MADYYFTEEELELLRKLDFDLSVFETLKRSILIEINHMREILPERFAERLITYFPHTIESLVYFDNGITSNPPRGISIQGTIVENPQLFVENLNNQIKEQGYIAFLTDSTVKPPYNDQIAVIRTLDPLEIFNLLPTPFKYIIGNPHYHIKNEQVIQQLKHWHRLFDIEILGVGYNWIEIKFNQLPENLDELIEDIKGFSPDAFGWWENETPEEVELKVVKRLKIDHLLYCWWEE